jgi:hypothetical protein
LLFNKITPPLPKANLFFYWKLTQTIESNGYFKFILLSKSVAASKTLVLPIS